MERGKPKEAGVGLEPLSSILTPISRFKLHSHSVIPRRGGGKTAIGGIVRRWNAFKSCPREWRAEGLNWASRSQILVTENPNQSWPLHNLKG